MKRRGTAAQRRAPAADRTQRWAGATGATATGSGLSGRFPALRGAVEAHPAATVLLCALPVLVVKLLLAARTIGTRDMLHWADFLAGVRTAGPVGIYGVTFRSSFYNHPPLMGYVLWVVNGLRDAGISDNFTIRALASLCDVGSAFVLLALLRRRRPLIQAVSAAALLAVSPLLLLVSGFHGNTDPDFVFLTMLGLYLLVDRKLPLYAGMAFALAIGVKIVPMIVLPAVAVYAWKRGGRCLVLLGAGFLTVFALTWGPALLTEYQPVKAHVIGYSGNGYSLWGIMQIGHWLGDPGWVAVLGGPGRIGLVVVCAVLPAVAVAFRSAAILPAAAWSLLVFLAFATTFGVQYLVWPVAVAYLVNVRWATAYSFSAGIMLAVIYNRWSGGLPWQYANPTVFTIGEKIGLVVPWLVLLVLIASATVQAVPRKNRRPTGTEQRLERGDGPPESRRSRPTGVRQHPIRDSK